ncbi:MAG: GTP 3',8-cyclase MoaA [Candidatus Tectomicrobia bacterium]|uniref:GTP 3',8-cyclase n=1 Tax=Tectimicrobiota bacterium TaxID=2528274 RepID=A0A932GPM0_UNCTE|nr:GTP 3',8-cyclase MoaA [Candidatus Tectomicrobia bacterium]
MANQLVDRFQRRITDLRVSVTDRCNLQCSYCMPSFGTTHVHRRELLSFEEIQRLVTLLASQGIEKVRLTGGEPLIRRDLIRLVQMIRQIPGVRKIPMTTNAVLLSLYAGALQEAGLTSANISLDTLQRERFQQITGFDKFDQVMAGIHKALEVGLPVKINVVAIRNFNDHEVLDFVELAGRLKVAVRFIEFMPFQDNQWSIKQFISARELRRIVGSRYKLVPLEKEALSSTSNNFRVEGQEGSIGFIASMTESFCSTCSRVRLTAEGYFRPCLHDSIEVDLKAPLREGVSDQELTELMQRALWQKWAEHPDFLASSGKVTAGPREMIRIGG